MAILFSKPLSETELLSSHNNNIVEFASNNVLTALSCVADFGTFTFERSPDPNGLFSFNLKEAAKVLINQNEFVDKLVPDIPNNGYVYQDDTLYKKINVSFKIIFEGGTTETVSKSYHFLKKISQPEKYSENVIDIVNTGLALLLPFEDNSNVSYYAPYFEGKPFDIALFSNVERTITVRNKTTTKTITLDLLVGVNRIFLSQGNKNITLEDELTLRTGINNLQFEIAPDNYITLLLERIESDCAEYVRFYNKQGAYSYYQFNIFSKESIKTKTIDSIDTNFNDISQTYDNEQITGKSEAVIKRVMAERTTDRQRKYLESIFSSPKVDIYLNRQFQPTSLDSWRGVKISDGSTVIDENNSPWLDVVLSIGYNNETLTL